MADDVKITPAFEQIINKARYNKLEAAADTASELSEKEQRYSKALLEMFARHGVPYDTAVKIINEWGQINRQFYSE